MLYLILYCYLSQNYLIPCDNHRVNENLLMEDLIQIRVCYLRGIPSLRYFTRRSLLYVKGSSVMYFRQTCVTLYSRELCFYHIYFIFGNLEKRRLSGPKTHNQFVPAYDKNLHHQNS